MDHYSLLTTENSTFVKALAQVIPTKDFLQIIYILQLANRYLQITFQTFIQSVSVMLQAALNLLPKRYTPGQLNKKKQTNQNKNKKKVKH